MAATAWTVEYTPPGQAPAQTVAVCQTRQVAEQYVRTNCAIYAAAHPHTGRQAQDAHRACYRIRAWALLQNGDCPPRSGKRPLHVV